MIRQDVFRYASIEHIYYQKWAGPSVDTTVRLLVLWHVLTNIVAEKWQKP